jgi:hypothetical protein
MVFCTSSMNLYFYQLAEAFGAGQLTDSAAARHICISGFALQAPVIEPSKSADIVKS